VGKATLVIFLQLKTFHVQQEHLALTVKTN